MRRDMAITRAGCAVLAIGAIPVSAWAQNVATAPSAPARSAERFDPAAMPESVPPLPPIGWRYADLTTLETGALRRGFSLPLDAIAQSKSPRDLLASATVAPLPDPNRPLLSVGQHEGASSAANPFDKSAVTAFRDNPLKAFAERLGASADEAPAGASTSDTGAFSDLSAGAASPQVSAEVPEAGEDPFSGGSDPFGGSDNEEDPFGDF